MSEFCTFINDGPGFVVCTRCGVRRKRSGEAMPVRYCTPDDRVLPGIVMADGPGSRLHDIILKLFGEGPTRECNCTDRINQMNAWGPAGCREHLDEITGWLVEQAKEHKWVKVETDVAGNEVISEATPPLTARMARWLAKRKWGAMPVRLACKQMVLSAIKKSESDATATAL